MEVYKHSGAVSFLGLLITATAGVLTAGVLGFIYTYLLRYIPYIYVKFFVTAGFASAIGLAVGLGSKTGKLRNKVFVALRSLDFESSASSSNLYPG